MEKLLIYVTTGTNQYNFARMLKICQKSIETIDLPTEVIVQFGSTADHKEHIVSNHAQEFFSRDEVFKFYEQADLIFSHCGIGSIYNSLSYNRPTVFIPRLKKYDEFSDDHQLQIAQEITRNPLLFVIDERSMEDQIDAFNIFVRMAVKVKKCERNLVNKDFCEKIAAFF